MNLLLDRLPDKVQGCAVRTDFRTMIQFEALLNNPGLDDYQKALAALELFYIELPETPQEAIDGLLWFYRGGKEAKRQAEEPKARLQQRATPKAYDFEQDAAYIYAAFLAQYGIDLNDVPQLHWWKFLALFQGLTEEQQITKIMGYRTVDTKGMGKGEKARYEKLKAAYKLETQAEPERLSYAAYKQSLIEYVNSRYAQQEQNGCEKTEG